MAVLSTLQQCADTFTERIRGTVLQTALSHKWSILAGTVALYATYKYLSRPRNLPPGPRGLPIIGSLLDLSMNIHLDCMKYSEKYKSDIISFYVGQQLNVILNSADAVKAAFVKSNDCAHRNTSLKVDLQFQDMLFSESYSEDWIKLKTFCMSSLKTHGFGNVKSEAQMRLQLNRMISHLETLPENTIGSEEMKELFTKAGTCVIMKIIANQDYEFDDPEVADFLARVNAFMTSISENSLILVFYTNIFPKAVMWPYKRKVLKKCKVAVENYREFIMEKIKEHKVSLDVNNSRDFIDDMLIGNMKYIQLTDMQMTDTILMFTPDATHTTSVQLAWMIFHICWHPEVQTRMVEEIKSVCGDDQPGLKDRAKMAYCEAVFLESYRLTSVTTMSGPHINVEDTHVKGYFIPKNTEIQANLYAVHYDEKFFPEPAKFKPTRFLSPEGKVANYENVMPFGAGQRKCVGEPLAKSQVFMYITGLVQKFELSFPEGHKPESYESTGIFGAPPAHRMKFTPRY